jgi:hypothetical protein
MLAVVKVVFQVALAAWIGTLLAVSFLVAPAVFHAAPSEIAGTIMGAIFPLYYGSTAASGVVALVAAEWLRRRTAGARSWAAIVVMLAAMLAATGYAGAVVSPQARALRPALHTEPVDPAVRATFDDLHRRAVQLNGFVLVLGLATIGVAAVSMRLPGER